jgi:predicted DNA-binding ribbon-helix-helix protein
LQQKVARTINKLIRLVERTMKSSVIKRSVVIAGHKTSVSLEDAFWTEFRKIAEKRNMTLSELAAVIDAGRRQGNLSSAIRLFVLDFYHPGSVDTGDRTPPIAPK